jgi:hypothetical protein
MDDQEARLRRVGMIGTLVVLIAGGLLLAAPALLTVAARSNDGASAAAPRRGPQAIDGRAAARALHPTTIPLPTIPAPELAAAPAGISTPTLPMRSATETTLPSTPTTVRDGAADLAPLILKHLACLVPGIQHDATLDGIAVARAQQDKTPLPKQGAIQIAEHDGQRILLSADLVIDLRVGDGRCGETLIFGVPPLDWLPRGARFGIGVATHAGAAVVVVIVR